MNLKDYTYESISGRRKTPISYNAGSVNVEELTEYSMEDFIKAMDNLTDGSMALDTRSYDISLETAYELLVTIHRNDRRLHYSISDGGAGIPELWIFNRDLNEAYRMMFRNGRSLEWILVYNVKPGRKNLVHTGIAYRGHYGTLTIESGIKDILTWLNSSGYIGELLLESYSDDRKEYLFKCLDKTSDYSFDVTLETCPELADYYSLSFVNVGREFRAHPEYLCVFLVEVNEDEQYMGNGTDFMSDLCEWADKNGKTITLTPSDDFGATSVGRLIKFYKRFGFVENKGKHTDFTTKQNMYRKPK
jgi:GNAT superfamily N-acetyltransferase